MPQIKRINRLKEFGIFQDYRKQSNLNDFNDKNIIYGWNYSGKTTISRLISFLDKNNPIESGFEKSEFEVELDNGMKITQENRATSPLTVRVFNSDFIKGTLHFDDTDPKIKGIKFAVGEAGEIQNKLKDIEARKIKATEIIQRNQNNTAKLDSIKRQFTDKAREITELLSLGRSFNRNNIQSIIDCFKKDTFESFILSESDLQENIKIATQTNTGKEIPIEDITIPYSSLKEEVDKLLHLTPQRSEQDEMLDSDSNLYKWVQDGLPFAKENEPCPFCGNTNISERIKHLNAYYSNEGSKVKKQISEIISKIQKEKDRINNHVFVNLSDNDLNVVCREEFLKSKLDFNQVREEYFKLLDNHLIKKLQIKESENLFTDMDLGETDETWVSKISQWFNDAKKIIEKNNKIFSEYGQLQSSAKENIKKHKIAEFLQENEYYLLERRASVEANFKAKLESFINNKESEQKDLLAQISSIIKGKEKLNEYINLFLNRDDLKIETTSDNYFILQRDNVTAKNLSDGERTAIAFSHFMVTLESLKESGKIQDTIIFIDDPISSLDANHIAQVYSLINTFFFQKGLDPAKPDSWGNCFSQLFISTHNFEFFSFIKKSSLLNKKKKVIGPDGKSIDAKACCMYLIQRCSKDQSVFTNLPSTLSSYNSEYVYLFSEIEKVKDEIDKMPNGAVIDVDHFYIMPNVVRRFLEIYTLMKLPGNRGEIDDRIKILIGNVNELKILHNFSHFTTLERATKHNELILRLPDVLADLYRLLDKDKEHLDSLREGTK